MAKKIQVTLVRSTVSCQPKQRRTLRALGLKKIGQTVEHKDTPVIRGMINVVDFMVTTEESK